MISIVIPAFNVAKYIKKCIDSILSQSYSDWELIIVDDHSNDDTVQIIKENYLGDDRINLIQRTKNSGGFRIPRFEGIKASTGKFICCIDADDFVEDTFLQKLIDREQQTGCSIILGKMVFCDQDDIIEDRTIPNKNFNMNIIEDGYNITQRTIGGWEIAMNGMLVKSDLYKDYICV